jgi:hypothetical protein
MYVFPLQELDSLLYHCRFSKCYGLLIFMQGVHTRVVEIICEANARSVLELYFEFKEMRARWAHQNRSKAQKE